ncbi:type II toxin-antitoxin system prevent-host-death family antitoxin [Microbispora hainanensis]|jgi:prevent-host-death family protein|uniref:Type II toxin-antitoxin system prevent-host-death family antitoxin n=1 Tax=Microbispora hainanensis TaxID=568844 RepID=A0ABZ1ST56_9ACTN|nr:MULTISPECIES: type II toxin-antitoxin system prevent-host-death family antitoxin [Microbispora]NJP27402.1 type II toxin-antitoxin system prevent-host-death family antitoxin [Microbispora sp. CL1-1]TQS11190.1 type II toxin-antitoxin system prevent-host-death family antitoxin [Microbispora sp. SCL1-1]
MSDEVVSVGVRELRDRLAHYLELVQAGNTVEITERGRPVAQLTALPHERVVTDRLVAEGRMKPPEVEIDWTAWHALPPEPGAPVPSEVLADLRADER